MAIAALIVSLAAPSLGVVAYYLGPAGVAAYLLSLSAVVLICRQFLLQRFLSRVSEKIAWRLAMTTLLVLLAAFAVVFPFADSGALGGGSDADDAIDLGGEALLRGEYPYYGLTYLANPISPFPGALLLGVPFVVAGTSALQGPFWLAVFFLFVRRLLGDVRLALLIVWAMLGLSPAVLQELLVGTDHLTNAIYVLVPATLLLTSAPLAAGTRSRTRSRLPELWALLLGIALSSRPNFLLLLPLVLASLARSCGFARGMRLVSVTAASCAAVTLPFFLFDPAGFSPLYNIGMKLEHFQSGVPLAGALVPITGAAAALALAGWRASAGWPAFMGRAAIVQAIPVAMVAALEWIGGSPFPVSLSYGLHALPFAALAVVAVVTDLPFDAIGVRPTCIPSTPA